MRTPETDAAAVEEFLAFAKERFYFDGSVSQMLAQWIASRRPAPTEERRDACGRRGHSRIGPYDRRNWPLGSGEKWREGSPKAPSLPGGDPAIPEESRAFAAGDVMERRE